MTGISAAFLLLLTFAFQLPQEKPDPLKGRNVQEKVAVERVVLTGRVIDSFARPIPSLTAGDFRLRVDGHETPIESAEWIPGGSLPSTTAESALRWKHPTGPPRDASAPLDEAAPAGRTIVMLFQWEIAGQKDEGFVRMMRQAKHFVETANPTDRFAVLGYGASLKLLQDLTTDHRALLEAIEAVRGWKPRRPAVPDAGPALWESVAGCGSTGSIQKAIICIGNSLQVFPGSKTLLFFGWTIGKRRGPEFLEYPRMVEAISKAHTSVWVLDVSDGRHTLATGISQLASDTGGLYNGGCLYEMVYCADLATLKTQRAVEGGAYEIVFRDPAVARGWHEVEIELIGRSATLLFPRWYRD